MGLLQKWLTAIIFAQRSILGGFQGFEYASVLVAFVEYDLYDVEIAFKDVETATFTNLLYRKPIDVAGHVR